MDDDYADTLVTRRSRRSTAGNLMQAALADVQNEMPEDIEDDDDFLDQFDEDFASDSEKTESEEEVHAERAVQEEDKRRKLVLRSRSAERTAAVAHSRLRATFNPEESSSKAGKSPGKRKVAFAGSPRKGKKRKGQGDASLDIAGERHSSRAHTMKNTTATAIRMKETERRKAAQGPKRRAEGRAFTQAELIRRALDNEEGNVSEHRDYLKREEEKRRRARVQRKALVGPLVRWVSRGEEVVTRVPDPYAPRTSVPAQSSGDYHAYEGADRSYAESRAYASNAATATFSQQQQPDWPHSAYYPPHRPRQSSMSSQLSSHYPPHLQHASPNSVVQTQTPAHLANVPSSSMVSVPTYSAEPLMVEGRERIARSYIVHELGQDKDVQKPRWADTMSAVFGDHVDWTDVKAYSSAKNRPTARLRHVCPITGQIAPYIDPRTGVPFANAQAYKTLTAVLDHEYAWNREIGAYVG
ncbi:YL1 nuclear protein-domain-containing protein [Schizophyllum amplum]|uniref:YL1 nuclear protein-domain-containing protein n=1 Tax=Schizophyllum amplum TaxID=97359 RepID=A0A550CH21_9AGAR|nr:YL1 nuclear protein-domain-containing protein [Auriculariopsis ampla]